MIAKRLPPALVAVALPLTLFPLPAAPVANPDSYAVPEDRALRIAAGFGVLANDIEDGPVAAVLENTPSHGLLQFFPDGSFNYQPDPDFSGTDSFSYYSLGSAGEQLFTVDQAGSQVTVSASVSIAGVGSDSSNDSSSVTGSITADPTPSTAPFRTIHITDLDLNLAESLSLNFSFAFGLAGVNVTSGPNAFQVRMANPGPVADVDGTGNFTQNDNAVSVTGNIDVDATGLAGGLVEGGPQTITIDDQTLGFNGNISQNGNELVLRATVSFSGQFDVGGNPIDLEISGDIRATSPLAPPAAGNTTTVTLNVLPGNDLPRAASESYSTQGPLTRSGATAGGTDLLVAQGANWSYLVDDSPPPADWTALAFAGRWPSGPAQLGFDEGDEGTVIGFGGDPGDKNVSTWFRHIFPVTNADAQGELLLRLLRDDGAAVYLNGTEVVRSNLEPLAGPAVFATTAVSGPAESFFYEFTLPASLLEEGSNILAVEVHQATAGSSDLSFDLELIRQRYSGGVLGNDRDVDSTNVTARVHRQPRHGTLQLAPDGTFTYTPDPGFSGTDTFLYEAVDGNPLSITEILPFGSIWSYLDDGSDQGTSWRDANFDDSSWETGRGELGYGETDQATTVGFIDTTPGNPATTTRNATTYFRRSFLLGNPGRLINPALRLIRDDAAAVYLNGVEIYRDANLGAGAPHDSFATSGVTDENEIVSIPLSRRDLRRGRNVLAVEIHQSSASSSDIAFDLAIVAETTGIATLLPLGATWKFADNGSDLGTAWVQPPFNDSLWLAGPAPLGFGNGNEATLVTQGAVPRRITTYFRTDFEVADASEVLALGLDLLRDDGAAIYLNGNEIVRDNLPADALFDTLAPTTVGTTEEPFFNHHWGLDPAFLVDGTNILSVEIHQASDQSSDLAFDMRLNAIVSASLGVATIEVRPTLSTDTDADGMEDAWENANDLVVGIDDSARDEDGDGENNLSEFHAGTDPRDSTSLLRILEVNADGTGNYEVRFSSVVGRLYRLQFSSDLENWSEVAGAETLATAPLTELSGTNFPPNPEKAYFRVLTSRP